MAANFNGCLLGNEWEKFGFDNNSEGLSFHSNRKLMGVWQGEVGPISTLESVSASVVAYGLENEVRADCKFTMLQF